jgi:beta-phosphoglucomutase-like phosphatase (HAD superfamily)
MLGDRDARRRSQGSWSRLPDGQPWSTAAEIDESLEALGLGSETVVVDRGDVERAKPDPDLFFACAAQLAVSREECYVVGDAVWDLLAARRAPMLSIGILSGGYGEHELARAGAFRVYRDTSELRESLDELGLLS